jgi:hypothetical protein
MLMEQSPEQLVCAHGIKPLGTGITDALAALITEPAALEDSVGGGGALQVTADLLLDILVRIRD